jgi:hypothetical protein
LLVKLLNTCQIRPVRLGTFDTCLTRPGPAGIPRIDRRSARQLELDFVAAKTDRLADLYGAVGTLKPDPWLHGGRYAYDRDLLRRLIQVQVDSGKADNAQTGGVALAVDVWVACELRRAGIDRDIVWPRAEQPRVVPQSLSRAVKRFKLAQSATQAEVQRKTIDRLVELSGSSRSTIVGGQFNKEVDVVIADDDRGLELAVSTKAMTDSYGKNVSNRWEEASGDLLNIRRRFPLAAFGFAFIVTEPILLEATSFDRVKDMLRKLTTVVIGTEGSAYDSACLVLTDWSSGTVRIHEQQIPPDLSANRFFERLLPALFARSPVTDHKRAREMWLASQPPDAPL